MSRESRGLQAAGAVRCGAAREAVREAGSLARRPAGRPTAQPALLLLIRRRAVNESCFATGECSYYAALSPSKPLLGIEYCDAGAVVSGRQAGARSQLCRWWGSACPAHPRDRGCPACPPPADLQLGAPTQDPACLCAKALQQGWFFILKQHELGAAGQSCGRYCQ